MVDQIVIPLPDWGRIGTLVFKHSLGGYYILQRTCAAWNVLVYKLPQVFGNQREAPFTYKFGQLLARSVVKVIYFLVISKIQLLGQVKQVVLEA